MTPVVRRHALTGAGTLFRKEVLRFWKVSFQTVAAPVLTSILYLLDRNGRFVTHFTHDAKAEAIAAAVGKLL